MKKKIFSIALLGLLSTLNADVISKNGIAKDSVTGLEWQDNSDAKTIEKDWIGAKDYCENLTLGGKSDWRIPNIYELSTLLDNTKSNKPYIIDGFKNIASENYWSSTTDAYYSNYAWVMYFDDGIEYTVDKVNNDYVRCVRAGQLNFDNLVILKNKGKVKVSQKNIDYISTKKEPEREKQESQTKTTNTRSYNFWKTGYKFENTSYISTEIKCSDGTNGTVFNYFGRDTSYHYVVNGYTFKNFEEAANNICGN